MIGSPVNIVSEIHSVKAGHPLPHDIPFGNIGRVMDIIRRENGFLTPVKVFSEIFILTGGSRLVTRRWRGVPIRSDFQVPSVDFFG